MAIHKDKVDGADVPGMLQEARVAFAEAEYWGAVVWLAEPLRRRGESLLELASDVLEKEASQKQIAWRRSVVTPTPQEIRGYATIAVSSSADDTDDGK